MAKGIYVGGSVSNFTTTTTTVDIDVYNISQYFSVTNGDYYFEGNVTIFTSNNKGIDDSTAQTTLTALQDISSITFSYSYASEANYDKFTLIVAGEVIEDGVSGAYTVKTYSGALAAGDVISFEYTKDVSNGEDYDECDFYNIKIQVQVQVPDGTIDNVARKVIQPYVGVNNVARKVTQGYIGVNNVARLFLGENIPYITWEKWSCTKTGDENYTEDSSKVGETTSTYRSFSGSVYMPTSYSFSDYYGYNSNDSQLIQWDELTTAAKVEEFFVGCYLIDNITYSDDTQTSEVKRIDSVEDYTMHSDGNGINISFGCTIVGYASKQPLVYTPGYYIGTVRVPEGELPETGTLLEGSANDSYCVMYSYNDHAYRYYYRQ